MNVLESAGVGSEALDPANFTGTGTLTRLGTIAQTPEVRGFVVRFDAGTRTAWHSHSGPQILIVTEGACRFQVEGAPVREVAAGGIISIDPAERHWHGASSDTPMTHIALNIAAITEWFEKVTDDQYRDRSG